MTQPGFDSIKVGDEIPILNSEPITRHTLALYCGASGDHHPIHVDSDYAREGSLDDVIAHGMFSMAYVVIVKWPVCWRYAAAPGRASSVSYTHLTLPTNREV